MTTSTTPSSRLAGRTSEVTGYWWVPLVTGVAWILLSLAILQFDMTSVWSIAILTGVVLCIAGGNEFVVASVAPHWKVAHFVLGVFFLVGGITAFAWPDSTFTVLARLVGWYLIFLGTFEIVESLATRGELWWLRLISGIACLGLAFWAVHSLTRSATLLILWVGIAALMRGVTQVFAAFDWRHVHKDVEHMASRSAPTQVDLTETQTRAQTS